MEQNPHGSSKRARFLPPPVSGLDNNQEQTEVELAPAARKAALRMSKTSPTPASEPETLTVDEEYWAHLLESEPESDETFEQYAAHDSVQVELEAEVKQSSQKPEPNCADYVLATLRLIVAAQHGLSVEQSATFFSNIRHSETVLNRLSEQEQLTWASLLELLEIDSANRHAGRVDLNYVPLSQNYGLEVLAELAVIQETAKRQDLPDPGPTWFALVEYVQRVVAATSATRYLNALKNHAPVEKLINLHKKINPPTTKRDILARKTLPTARAILEEARAAKALTPTMRLSFGLPTLDRALTNPSSKEPVGSIGLGEQMVIAGPTGTGKTSMFYTILASLVQDLVNLGKRDARVIALHTEETSEDKLKGAGFAENQRHHHLVDNLIIENIGSSRKRIVEVIYDVVIDAIERSKSSGRPITDFAPYAFLLDYIQEINEPGENEVTATLATAQLIKNGIMEFSPEEMAKYSGVSFPTYAGMPWPSALRSHRVAVVTFAQLKKLNDSDLYYRTQDHKLPVSDFALEDTRPQILSHLFEGAKTDKLCLTCQNQRSLHPKWIGPDGANYHWEVKEGDLRILKQNQIRGHGMILQAATTIVFLHRSQPRNNPAVVKSNGRRGLMDTRARLILDKTRTGSSLVYVPLAFDLTVDGLRARFYDEIAQVGLKLGTLKLDTSVYSQFGDPMLPPRALQSPLSGIRY